MIEEVRIADPKAYNANPANSSRQKEIFKKQAKQSTGKK